MKRTVHGSSECFCSANASRRMTLRASAQTMVELLVVISIILILMAILLPALRRSIHQAANTVCMANLREIHQALQIYRLDNGGWLPVATEENGVGESTGATIAWYRSLFPRKGDLSILVCPEDPMGELVRKSLSLGDANEELPELTSYGLNQIILSSEDQYLANLDRYSPRRPWDTLLVADLGADISPSGHSATADTVAWLESVRRRGLLPIDDGYDPSQFEQVPPWLTGRHSGGINMVTFGGGVRHVSTRELMAEPIDNFYDDCASGGCTVCLQLELPHYNFSFSGTYWWTGSLPRR